MEDIEKDKFMDLINLEVKDLKINTFDMISDILSSAAKKEEESELVLVRMLDSYMDYTQQVDDILKKYISYTNSLSDTSMSDFLKATLN